MMKATKLRSLEDLELLVQHQSFNQAFRDFAAKRGLADNYLRAILSALAHYKGDWMVVQHFQRISMALDRADRAKLTDDARAVADKREAVVLSLPNKDLPFIKGLMELDGQCGDFATRMLASGYDWSDQEKETLKNLELLNADINGLKVANLHKEWDALITKYNEAWKRQKHQRKVS